MNKPILNIQNAHLGILTRYLLLAFLWFGSPLNVIAASAGCDDAFVQLADDILAIDVAPNGADDTANIQCALDIATAGGVPVVRLEPATYFISAIRVENFKGTFQGRTIATTILKVLDQSIDCIAMEDSGLRSAAIKFVKGEPRIRFMTVRASSPCVSDHPLSAILHFTGESAQIDNCNNDVIFAVVDRVVIDGMSLNRANIFAGIKATAEGRLAGGCKVTLLGTFKINRSTVSEVFAGLVTSMRASAQVDINFNKFEANVQAINLVETNQNTTITQNTFFGDNLVDDRYSGVIVTNFRDAPPSTRLVVNKNEFNISSTFPGITSVGVRIVFAINGGPVSKVSAVITNNRFKLSGNKTYGIRIRNTSNTHVSANNFNGSGARAIYVYGDIPVTGWTITANTGLAGFTSFLTEDIRLASNTSLNIVGGGQGASVQDDGVNNTILPQ